MLTPYLTAESSGRALVVTIRAGLFDRMPEMATSGPAVADLVGELNVVLQNFPDGVVFDARPAGEFNHRTVAALVALVRSVPGPGSRQPVALCMMPGHLAVWNACRFERLCRAFTELPDALAAVAAD